EQGALVGEVKQRKAHAGSLQDGEAAGIPLSLLLFTLLVSRGRKPQGPGIGRRPCGGAWEAFRASFESRRGVREGRSPFRVIARPSAAGQGERLTHQSSARAGSAHSLA